MTDLIKKHYNRAKQHIDKLFTIEYITENDFHQITILDFQGKIVSAITVRQEAEAVGYFEGIADLALLMQH